MCAAPGRFPAPAHRFRWFARANPPAVGVSLAERESPVNVLRRCGRQRTSMNRKGDEAVEQRSRDSAEERPDAGHRLADRGCHRSRRSPQITNRCGRGGPRMPIASRTRVGVQLVMDGKSHLMGIAWIIRPPILDQSFPISVPARSIVRQLALRTLPHQVSVPPCDMNSVDPSSRSTALCYCLRPTSAETIRSP